MDGLFYWNFWALLLKYRLMKLYSCLALRYWENIESKGMMKLSSLKFLFHLVPCWQQEASESLFHWWHACFHIAEDSFLVTIKFGNWNKIAKQILLRKRFLKLDNVIPHCHFRNLEMAQWHRCICYIDPGFFPSISLSSIM